MRKFVLFLLGKKGYKVLQAIVQSGFTDLVELVVVGADQQVIEDYSCEITNLCQTYGVKCVSRSEFNDCQAFTRDVIALAAGWRWMIAEKFWQIIVFHDSLLPKYRGFNPLVTALLRRDPEIGVTAIIACKEFDRGEIIDSVAMQVNYPITIEEAIDFISELYFELTTQICESYRNKEKFLGSPQDESKASYSVWRDEEDYIIDWRSSSEAILHFINCVSFPYRGASTFCNNQKIRILQAALESDIDIANRDVGKVLFVKNSQPVIICGTGLLRITTALDEFGNDALPFPRFRVRLNSG